MKFRPFFFYILLFSPPVFSQNDSTLLLTPERLTEKDILTRNLDFEKTKIISATRSPEDADQLPFTTWVVTADDILRNGYATLGDVLRAAPGIRVSQPGNAMEGETFLMRGLSGNQYVKILINDVPMKPGIALGMPIGAQLPIRQAERIEVLYGPAAAIYGNEACAGVVNIILKETERPIFTQADLVAFGNYGFNSLDLMFGGKLGKDKKIFRFSLYGSSTVREKTDLYHDRNLYNANHYLPFGLDSSLYLENPNYRAEEPPTDSFPKTAAISHESRLLGINLTWRGLHLTYNRMLRFDHSALGISPLAVSYSNPSNRLAERLETFSLGFTRTRPNWVARNTFSAVRYRLDNTSTTTYVFDRLSAAIYRVQMPSQPDQQAQVLRDVFNNIASNERYTAATGLDLRFESLVKASLFSRFALDLGIQVNGGGGVPALTHYDIPLEIRLDGSTTPDKVSPYSPSSYSDLDGNLFGQLTWRGKRFYATGGCAVNYSYRHGLLPAPRGAVLYQLDSTWSLRANFATGIRRPSMFAKVNSYYILDFNGTVNVSPVGLDATERVNTWEIGFRRIKNSFKAEGIFFYQKAYRLARPGYLRQEQGIVAPWRYGYENAPGLALSMWGVQGLISSENREIPFTGRRRKTVITGRTEIYFQYAQGKEWFGDIHPRTDDVLNAPRWHFQFRTFFTLSRFQMVLASNRQTSVLSKAVIYRDNYQRKVIQERYPAFRSWDVMARFYLSNHLLVYCHVQNLFNRHYAGLDATGTPDDLLYNPQQGRLLRLGVNYNMN